MELFYNIFIILLVLNGLFFSLATHKQHCDLGKYFKINNCVNHNIHIIFGIFSLLLAIIIKQRNHLFG